MADFFFALKILILTFVIVTVMQVKIGPATIEQHTQEWIRTSPAIAALQGVADGAIKAGQQATKVVSNQLDANFGGKLRAETQPGTRLATILPKRSIEVEKLQEAKNEAKAEAAAALAKAETHKAAPAALAPVEASIGLSSSHEPQIEVGPLRVRTSHSSNSEAK